jgi:hypothetical protein
VLFVRGDQSTVSMATEAEAEVEAEKILTAIERLEFVACLLCALHALQQRSYASIIFAPKVVGNCKMVSR